MYNRYIENRDKYLNVLFSLLMTLIEWSQDFSTLLTKEIVKQCQKYTNV